MVMWLDSMVSEVCIVCFLEMRSRTKADKRGIYTHGFDSLVVWVPLALCEGLGCT